MNMITVSAKTLDEAITKALIELETTSDNLDYTIVEKGSAGLLGFIGAKPVVISVKKKREMDTLEDFLAEDKQKEIQAKKKDQEAAAEKKEAVKKEFVPASPSGSGSDQAPEAKTADKYEKPMRAATPKEDKHLSVFKRSVDGSVYEESAKSFLIQMFKAMNMNVEITASYHEKDRELSVDMIGSDMGILIGKRGQTLDSLQYLVSLVVNKDCDGYVRVKLDTENYRARRKETLEILAKNIAYKVKRTKRSVSLEPMNPYERRIIHAALQNDKAVVTRSEGEEPFRHVVVSLKRDGRDRDNS